MTNSGESSKNALYRNLGNGQFKDVAGELGIADVNQTGNATTMILLKVAGTAQDSLDQVSQLVRGELIALDVGDQLPLAIDPGPAPDL